jgi:hypothetical protein
MPAASGQRWLAEADSFLFEVGPELQAAAARSYLRSAPLGDRGELGRRAGPPVPARGRRPGAGARRCQPLTVGDPGAAPWRALGAGASLHAIMSGLTVRVMAVMYGWTAFGQRTASLRRR